MNYKRTDLQNNNHNRLFKKENNFHWLQYQVRFPKAIPGRAAAKYNSVFLQYSKRAIPKNFVFSNLSRKELIQYPSLWHGIFFKELKPIQITKLHYSQRLLLSRQFPWSLAVTANHSYMIKALGATFFPKFWGTNNLYNRLVAQYLIHHFILYSQLRHPCMNYAMDTLRLK